jgi:hypothetical protein
MGIEVPNVRVLLEDGGQLYTMTGIAPRYPRLGEKIVFGESRYEVISVEHIIKGVFGTNTIVVHVIIRPEKV